MYAEECPRKPGDNKNQKYFTKKRRGNTTIKNKQICQPYSK